MAHFLLTWELGMGLGHLMSLRPLALGLSERGHKVTFAGRDLSQVSRAFSGAEVILLPAPYNSRPTNRIDIPLTFADILFNIGFGDQLSLHAHIDAWRNIVALVGANAMVCDHSPTAILAARGLKLPVATIGLGFFCPIDESPTRLLRSVPGASVEQAMEREQLTLGVVNKVLGEKSMPRLERITGLYHDGDTKHVLATFAELDQWSGRANGDYCGVLPNSIADATYPDCVDGEFSLFAYLRAFPALEDVLKLLKAAPFRTVAYIDGLSASKRSQYQSSRLTISDRPLDLRRAVAECAAALTNGNHATCAAMLLGGKPLVAVPTHLEQWATSTRIHELGLGILAPENNPHATFSAIERVLTDPAYAIAAKAFASRHANIDFAENTRKVIDGMEAML